jgi:hypothetical protein
LRFWARIPDKGLKIAKYTDQNEFSYYPGIHNIALLDLFGFLSVQSGKPEAGKGWRITRLQRLPFGDAMLRLLFTIYSKKALSGSLRVTSMLLSENYKPISNPSFPNGKIT